MGLLRKIFTSKSQNIKNDEIVNSYSDQNELPEEVLVAIFTACIMSCSSNRKLVVKSFKRVDSKSPIWNLAGKIELTKSSY